MPKINQPLIEYTARDFASIKEELVNYAQKYYPEAFQDFNEASFGSLMLDMVSYIGDMLSFYIDYQANESFLETATELTNILNISRQFGYKYKNNPSSLGTVSFFIKIPSLAGSSAPDLSYAPILRRGTTVSTADNKIYTLIEDIDFANSSDIVVASSNADGTNPTGYAIKAQGVVISGEALTRNFTIGAYQKFLRLDLEDPYVTEIISVFDAEGNNYYEVDYLTQDTVYVPVVNTNINTDTVPNILKPITVPRRYVTDVRANTTVLQFGHGTSNNEERLLDPTTTTLNVFGKDYITDRSFDPTILLKTDKLGSAPVSTLLTVVYRRNSAADVNASAGAISNVAEPLFSFVNSGASDPSKQGSVRGSLEVINEEQVVGSIPNLTAEEIKLRAYGVYGAQNRAVTQADYISMVYNMPPNFGQVKKAAIMRDLDSFNGKNLNLYVLSADAAGSLINTNTTIKQNLRTWVNKHKMLGDTIDILDGFIINLKVDFTIAAIPTANKYDTLQKCLNALQNYYSQYYYDIGERFSISDIYKVLNSIPEVLDTKNVTVLPETGLGYSAYNLDYQDLASADGLYLIPPKNVVFEIKYLNEDITGEVL